MTVISCVLMFLVIWVFKWTVAIQLALKNVLCLLIYETITDYRLDLIWALTVCRLQRFDWNMMSRCYLWLVLFNADQVPVPQMTDGELAQRFARTCHVLQGSSGAVGGAVACSHNFLFFKHILRCITLRLPKGTVQIRLTMTYLTGNRTILTDIYYLSSVKSD